MSAALKRRVTLLEAKLAAVTAAHSRTVEVCNTTLHELVEIKLRNQAAIEALQGRDYFGVVA